MNPQLELSLMLDHHKSNGLWRTRQLSPFKEGSQSISRGQTIAINNFGDCVSANDSTKDWIPKGPSKIANILLAYLEETECSTSEGNFLKISRTIALTKIGLKKNTA